MTRRILAFGLILLGVGIAQQGSDPFYGVSPHQVPHCDIPPRAAKANAAGTPTKPCTCPGMVSVIQQREIESCFARFSDLPYLEGVSETAPQSEALKNCLKMVPDHCKVIALPKYYASEGLKKENKCGTECKPERCGCKDGACASHEESEEY